VHLIAGRHVSSSRSAYAGVMQCGTFSRSIGCLWKNRAVCPPASGESVHTRTSPRCGHTLRHHPLQPPSQPPNLLDSTLQVLMTKTLTRAGG
jgi:hypothetical protein